jgi:outer membrane receptor protein involved in Fe transport
LEGTPAGVSQSSSRASAHAHGEHQFKDGGIEMSNARVQNRSLSLAAAVSLTLLTSQINAQERQQTEEIIVTGSYIKRDTFDAPSPTEVIDSTTIAESGAPTIGNFIRDLTFTQNTDVVANVLGTQDGQQDSNSANFNIRGLGVGSTLTLFDGRRIVDPGSVGSVVPELAMQRFEVVLDGGAALYGTDAVAGVVNIIPVKKFNGFKTRAYYNQDEDNTFHQPKYSLLAGTTFFEALDVVVAADYSKKTALYRAERPEYLRIDNDSSNSGNPGTYTRLVNGVPGTLYRDPACGTFNQGWEDHGMQGSFPSGTRSATSATTCFFEYGQYQDYARPAEDTNVYLSAVYAITDKIDLEFQANGDWRTSTLITSPSTALTANNTKLTVPVNNPGNESGSVLRIGGTGGSGWRPFTHYGTLPSYLDHRGANSTDYDYTTDRYKLGLTYDFGDTSWSGETWVSTQTTRTRINGYAPLMSRMQAALNGQGGPNGNEFWNPFGNSDPRAGVVTNPTTGAVISTGYNPSRANSQQLIDWLWVPDVNDSEREELRFVESIVTGELFDLPSGALSMAFGLQVRELERTERDGPAAARRDDYNTDIFLVPNGTSVTYNEVRAAFAEFSVPILDNLTMQIAGRHEEFVDLDLKATSPKVAVRYEPFNSLAFRASYGEGFLAPTPNQVLVESSPSCAEVFTGTDPFHGTSIAGSSSCINGNPTLHPEESEIYNIGLSWEVIADLEFSLDFQHIEYTDRILQLTATDLLNRDFANFVAANSANFATPGTYNRNAAGDAALRDAWFSSGMDSQITRGTLTNGIFPLVSVTRTFENLSSNEVDVFDAKVKYSFDVGDFGYFSTQLSSTYYSKYEYTGFDKKTADAVGLQNGQTNLAPPLPQWKHNFRTAWTLGNHNAAMAAKYSDGVKFDNAVTPGVTPPDRISSYTTFDVRYGYTFDDVFSIGKLDVAIGSSNVTDAKPDRLPIIGGLETRLGDPFGRQYYAELNFSFE